MATKPVRLKGSSLTIFANDTLQHRVQRFGRSGRLDSEDIREIGNAGIVEVSEQIPAVDITMDTNQSGLIRTAATLARKSFDWGFIQVKPSTGLSVEVTSGDYFINELAYSYAGSTLDMTSYLPATGSPSNHCVAVVSIDTAGSLTVTKGPDTSSATITVCGTPTGDLKIAEVYLYDTQTTILARHIVNRNDDPTNLTPHTLILKDYETAYVDFVVPIKEVGDNETADPISRTEYISKAYVTRYDANFTAQGIATENWSLESDNKTHYLGDAKKIVVDRIAGTGVLDATTVYSSALTYTPTTIGSINGADRSALYVCSINTSTDVWSEYDENKDPGFSISGQDITFTNSNPGSGTTIKVRYCSSNAAAGEFMTILPNPESPSPQPPGALRGGHVEIYLSDDATNHVARLQSVTVGASLNREPLYEIGAIRAYSRPVTFPLPITLSIEMLASDLEEFSRLCGKNVEFDAGTLKYLSLNDFIKTLDLTVKIFRENNETRDTYEEVGLANSIHRAWKTITVENLTVTDTNEEESVDGNGTVTFGLKANNDLTWIAPY